MTPLASALVRRYPLAWRERYEAEVLALLEDSPPGLRDLLELTRGLVVERVKSWVEPGEHPAALTWTVWPLLWLVRIAPAVVLLVLAMTAGQAIRQYAGEPPEMLQWTYPLLLIGPVVYYEVRVWRRVDDDAATAPWRRYRFFSVSERVCLVGLTLVGIVIMQWSPIPGIRGGAARFAEASHWLRLAMWSGLVFVQLMRALPWQQMWNALDEYRTVTSHLRWARMELDRCRTLAGPEGARQLEAAEREWHALEHRRQAALDVMHSYGYRATFKKS